MNTNDGIDHHDEAQEEILFPSTREAMEWDETEDWDTAHWDDSVEVDDDRDDSMSDMEADCDTLASAGWGTDEDYGGDRCDHE